METIYGTWPWYIGGPLVALIMLALIKLGKSFGFSSNFRTLCSALGAGKSCDFFDFDWKAQRWNLLFLFGTIVGGFVASHWLANHQAPPIAEETITTLQGYGFQSAGKSYLPPELFFNLDLKNILLLLVGGVFVGFGTRYAGGCTSGHAISGLSNLQWPSLVAVVGFFIGGLLMVHVLFPFIF
ncbi:YeeE/YedE family protein [Sphingobacterium litopenaei]|uniref:YeeE/YedE family protein n=1 Tax=Sphingobacterium litopenaei TaxID=2763500 RepID=A0ABR7YGX2_9SPHI|nr:YeeE/YedE thiosulfate transporter family protein [Sphingobacterium litopenaei]MBD1430552.1 YeeE/YedE family protein [Sphingobacterium litopenaei]